MTRESKTVLIIEGCSVQASAIGQLLEQNRLGVLYAVDGWDG